MIKKKTNSTSSIIKIIENNTFDACRSWEKWKNIKFQEDKNYTFSLSNINYPIFNNVFNINFNNKKIENIINNITQIFVTKELPFSLWVGPNMQSKNLNSHLINNGFVLVENSSGMCIDLLNIILNKFSLSIKIKTVTNKSDLHLWNSILTSVYKFPLFVSKAWYDMHYAIGFGNYTKWIHYIGYYENIPVSTASLFLNKNTSVLTNITTIKKYRSNGIAKAISTVALLKSKQLGYRQCVLYTDTKKEKIFDQLGFKKYCSSNVYFYLNK